MLLMLWVLWVLLATVNDGQEHVLYLLQPSINLGHYDVQLTLELKLLGLYNSQPLLELLDISAATHSRHSSRLSVHIQASLIALLLFSLCFILDRAGALLVNIVILIARLLRGHPTAPYWLGSISARITTRAVRLCALCRASLRGLWARIARARHTHGGNHGLPLTWISPANRIALRLPLRAQPRLFDGTPRGQKLVAAAPHDAVARRQVIWGGNGLCNGLWLGARAAAAARRERELVLLVVLLLHGVQRDEGRRGGRDVNGGRGLRRRHGDVGVHVLLRDGRGRGRAILGGGEARGLVYPRGDGVGGGEVAVVKGDVLHGAARAGCGARALAG